MHEIIPGILEKGWGEIERKIELVLPFAKTIHIDLLDGKFANNVTFADPTPFAKYAHQVILELHMMVEDPVQHLDRFAAAGFKRFLGHIEKMPDQVAFVAKAQALGEVGLALDGPTQLTSVAVPLEDLDCLLFYTSEKVGFSGPPFNETRLGRITQIRNNILIPLEVDGGINDQTILKARAVGVNRFVTTSFLFKDDPQKQFKLLQKALQVSA